MIVTVYGIYHMVDKATRAKKKKRTSPRDILVTRLQERFIALCWLWFAENRGNQTTLSKKVDTSQSRISELLNPDKSKRRPLSMYFVGKFIKRGIFMVNDIYDGRPESEAEREEWELLRTVEDRGMQKDFTRALAGSLSKDQARAFFRSHFSNTSTQDQDK